MRPTFRKVRELDDVPRREERGGRGAFRLGVQGRCIERERHRETLSASNAYWYAVPAQSGKVMYLMDK